MIEELNFTTLRQHWAKHSAMQPKFGTDRERELFSIVKPVAEELRQLGWDSAIYCPKDGSPFMGWEFPWGSPGLCRYSGEWPTGSWWMDDAGDSWPVRPNLWRPINAEEKKAIDKYRNKLRKDTQ